MDTSSRIGFQDPSIFQWEIRPALPYYRYSTAGIAKFRRVLIPPWSLPFTKYTVHELHIVSFSGDMLEWEVLIE
eukprot:COSAG02_NODE_2098_length_9831_cov_17.592581_7_plen_74_part_00